MENIIVHPHTKNIKLLDFGFSCYWDESQPLLEKVGTPYYIAPEILGGEGYGPEIDMWSIGVIWYILLTGKPPFYAKKVESICNKIAFQEPSYDDWDHLSKESKDFVKNLLIKNPSERMTPEQALKHPWINNEFS